MIQSPNIQKKIVKLITKGLMSQLPAVLIGIINLKESKLIKKVNF